MNQRLHEEEEPEHGNNNDDEEIYDYSDDDDDCFFETLDRVPSSVSVDFGVASSSDGSDDDEDDVRISFASAIAPPMNFLRHGHRMNSSDDDLDLDDDLDQQLDQGPNGNANGRGFDYGMWVSSEQISIKERRRLLLQGMGLASSKDLSALSSFRKAATLKLASPSSDVPSSESINAVAAQQTLPSSAGIVRSRSDTQLAHQTKEALARASSAPPAITDERESRRNSDDEGGNESAFVITANRDSNRAAADSMDAAKVMETGESGSFTIKNLDTGKEFVVSEVAKDGTWGRLNDLQTGLQLTLEEFERFLGYSPIVKELMRRVNLGGGGADKKSGSDGAAASSNNSKNGRKKGAGWLKNFKVVASSVTGLITEKEKERDNRNGTNASSSCGSEWMKVRQHGKSYKELTGLYMCQEIQAHQGSIWCMKFSPDSRYLASAGEDRIVRVWEVMERDAVTATLQRQERVSSKGLNPERGSSLNQSDRVPSRPSKRLSKKTKDGGSRRTLPDHIVLPETIFALSEKPICSFEGHLDDVLDISWSKSQNLLSSSMDKTVRLWDLETKACLKLFAHNDYVTCIQFNPIDESYFISGSLDAKVRIWSIPDRQVVDWSDLHEMVTAACYTPDGQGALVGSHKGSCRFYKTSDCKLEEECQIDIRNKKSKSNSKKITGFQFAPCNQSEVLITAADSQIRVFGDLKMVHKYRGFKNTSSQISASFTADGKYVVCASEDSNVYVWKHDATPRNLPNGQGKGKTWATTRSHEYFQCRDVSVAIPWPCSGSNFEPASIPSWFSWRKAYNDNRLGSTDSLQCSSNLEDNFQSTRSHGLFPTPKKKCSENCSPLPDDLCLSESGNGSLSFTSASSSSLRRSGPLSFGSSSSLLSWGWSAGGGSNRVTCSSVEEASAWGLVVVTAGLGGNIRVYQNFGLPVRLNRPPGFF